jgi:hypothetical protein
MLWINKKFLKELCAYCHYSHLRSLDIRHLGMFEATGLKSMGSLSSPPYKILSKPTNRFKNYQGVSLHPPWKFKRLPFWND